MVLPYDLPEALGQEVGPDATRVEAYGSVRPEVEWGSPDIGCSASLAAPAIRVSVVIPTHNRRELLLQVLQALGRQTCPVEWFEVVVVVDGSVDGTMNVLRRMRTPYRLSQIWQEQSGVARSRNAGVERAKGEVILFLDDDVTPFPRLIEEHLRHHAEDSYAVVIGRISPAVCSSRPGWSKWEEQLLDEHYRALTEKRRKVTGRHVYSGNFSVRREHFLAVGGFDETMSRAEDVDLGYRLERLGLRFYFNPRADGIHRGYRSYEAWARIPYQYGRLDVVMGRDKGHPGEMTRVFSTFYRRALFHRLTAALCLDREGVSTLFLGLLRRAAGCGDFLGLDNLTRYLYSGISNLRYWQGVADELGGSGVFWQQVQQHSPKRSERAYEFARTN